MKFNICRKLKNVAALIEHSVPVGAVVYTGRMARADLKSMEPLGRFSKGHVDDSRIALNLCVATHIAVFTKWLNIVAVVKSSSSDSRVPL